MPKPEGLPKLDDEFVFSVSQVETAFVCLRKWAFGKIDNIYAPPGKGAALGDEVHQILEKYLKFGVEIDTTTHQGKIAMTSVPHLPLPRTPGMAIERWFVARFGIAAYRGKKDVEIRDRPKPLILDHKTSKNPQLWMKDETYLQEEDIQAGVYSYDTFVETGKSIVELQWNFMQTEGKKICIPVKTEITRTQSEVIIEKTNRQALKMVEVIRGCKTANEAPADSDGCEQFGGCQHKQRCDFYNDPMAVLRSMMAQEEKKSSALLNDLVDRKNKKSGKSGEGKTPQEKAAQDTAENPPAEEQKVNPPERDNLEPPPPPAAQKVGAKWFTPTWDEAAFEWVWPKELAEAQEALEKQQKEAEKQAAKEAKAAEKAAGKVSVGKKNVTGSEATAGTAGVDMLVTLLEPLLDVLADKIAARLK